MFTSVFQGRGRQTAVVDLFFLTVFLTVLFLLFLGSHPLISPDETRYVGIAWDMYYSGDYVTPKIAGSPFLGKPILFYWSTIAAYKVFGVSHFSARFFPAMLGVFSCLIAYCFGRVVYNRLTGWLMSLLLAASPLFFAFTHYANMDGEVASWITCSLLSFLIASHLMEQERSGRAWLYASYFFAAMAFLTKGLMGLIFPGMLILAWVGLLRDWRLLLKIRMISGLMLFFVLTLPWMLLCEQANPGFIKYFFMDNQVVRFVGGNFNNQQPFYFFIPFVIAGVFPFTAYLFQALYAHIKHFTVSLSLHRTELFLMLWLVLITLFFSIPGGKPIGHIAPAIPPSALLLAIYFSKIWHKTPSWVNQVASIGVVAVFIVLATLMFGLPWLDCKQLVPGLVPYARFLAVFFMVSAGLMAFYLIHKKPFSYFIMTLILVTFVMNVSLIASLSDWRLQYNWPVAEQALAALKKHPKAKVIMFGRYYYSIPLYLNRSVPVVSNWHQLKIETMHDNWQREIFEGVYQHPEVLPNTLMDNRELKRLMIDPNMTLIIIAETSSLTVLDSFARGRYSIVANVPERNVSILLKQPQKDNS